MDETVQKNRTTFIALARQRVGDPHLAEDLVQESLVKTLTGYDPATGTDDGTVQFYFP